jgi:hypothetical protein
MGFYFSFVKTIHQTIMMTRKPTSARKEREIGLKSGG